MKWCLYSPLELQKWMLYCNFYLLYWFILVWHFVLPDVINPHCRNMNDKIFGWVSFLSHSVNWPTPNFFCKLLPFLATYTTYHPRQTTTIWFVRRNSSPLWQPSNHFFVQLLTTFFLIYGTLTSRKENCFFYMDKIEILVC